MHLVYAAGGAKQPRRVYHRSMHHCARNAKCKVFKLSSNREEEKAGGQWRRMWS